MDIHAAVRRKRKDLLRQDLSEGHNDDHLRRKSPQDLNKLRIPHPLGLINRNLVFQRLFLYRRHKDRFPAALGLIRLRHHSRRLMAGFHQCFQRRHRKVRRSHKYNPHLFFRLSHLHIGKRPFHKVYVKLPVQMIAFMENTAGQKPLRLDHLLLHVLIQRPYLYMVRPGHLALLSRYA